MSERALRFRLGLFVVIALILLACLVLLFGSLPGWFRQTKRYYVLFKDAPGISIGAPVRRPACALAKLPTSFSMKTAKCA